MPDRTLNILFPAGGIDESMSYEQQRPYTTPYCSNVRPMDVLEGRERGGSRPGLAKAFAAQLGSGNPVRMLNDVRRPSGEVAQFFTDEFSGSSVLVSADANWDAAGWADAGATESGGYAGFDGTDIGTVGDVITASALPLNINKQYIISGIFKIPESNGVEPFPSTFTNALRIQWGLNDTTPAESSCSEVVFYTSPSGGDLRLRAAYRVDGSVEIYNGLDSGVSAGDVFSFELRISPNHSVTLYINGNLASTRTISAGASSGNTRVGYTLARTATDGESGLSRLAVQYYDAGTGEQPEVILIGSSNGGIWRENAAGVMAEHTGLTLSLGTSEQIDSAERLGVLYIADHEQIGRYTDGVVTSDNQLDLVTATDWTTVLTGDPDDYILEILTSGNGSTAGVYNIDAINAGYLEISHAEDGSNPGNSTGNLVVRIHRSGKIYDPTNTGSSALTKWTTGANNGSYPIGCKILTNYRDRMVLTGDEENPGVWYMSRVGEPGDFNYSGTATDVVRAMAGTNDTSFTTSQGYGLSLPYPITAAIAFNQDYMILATERTMFRLVGDPAYQGYIEQVSTPVGIIGRHAWAVDDLNYLYFMSHEGLYRLAPSQQAIPEPISDRRLPESLKSIDSSAQEVIVRYEPREHLLHIFLTKKTAASVGHWIVDLRPQLPTFWPVTLPNLDHHPLSCHYYRSNDASSAALLLGCRDGYIRKYVDGQTTDDGTTFSSIITLGPIRIGQTPDSEGTITRAAFRMDNTSESFTWYIGASQTAEGSINEALLATGTITSGLSYSTRTRVRGVYATIQAASSSRWAMESAQLDVKYGGRSRKL